ncbi:MAG: 2Fe-2S iron-sulfur cluster-binding protein [Nitrospirae bacterium]|jgi:2Fe-2S ferredoxin|nr:2Fe-2S iron-sulfur cluster-binding protein [Nitrospirota bacterium]
MPKIHFPELGKTIEASEGESILKAALRAGIPVEHNCGGVCACSTCHVIVEEGGKNLSPMEEDEEDQLDEAEGLTLKSRLSCQAIVHGDIVVRIPPCTKGGHEH